MSVNRSILKKSRHIGFGVFIVYSSMAKSMPTRMRNTDFNLFWQLLMLRCGSGEERRSACWSRPRSSTPTSHRSQLITGRSSDQEQTPVRFPFVSGEFVMGWLIVEALANHKSVLVGGIWGGADRTWCKHHFLSLQLSEHSWKYFNKYIHDFTSLCPSQATRYCTVHVCTRQYARVRT
jgi:hypothetical protein